jgi:hypothetical protein
MSVLTHDLEALTLLLHRIGIVAESVDVYATSLYLGRLSGSWRFYECSLNRETCASGDILEGGSCDKVATNGTVIGINDDLYALDGRAIVEGNEVDGLAATMGAHPSLDTDRLSVFGATENIDDFCSFHFSMLYYS